MPHGFHAIQQRDGEIADNEQQHERNGDFKNRAVSVHSRHDAQ